MTIATLEEGRFIEVNEAFLRDVGFSARGSDRPAGARHRPLARTGGPRTELVRRLQRDGMVRRYEFEARTRLRERQINQIWAEKINLGGQDCLLDIVWDVTEWRANEEAMRRSRQELRDLAARLQTVREEERTRIARELHDELGQALTGLKMDLSWVRGRLPRTQSELPTAANSITRVDGTVDSVRRIATELRPGVLDLLGLVAAIEWQSQEFVRRTGIETDLDLQSDDSPVDDDVRATTMFRILQEALTNVARHAGATRVRIGVTADPGGTATGGSGQWARYHSGGAGRAKLTGSGRGPRASDRLWRRARDSRTAGRGDQGRSADSLRGSRKHRRRLHDSSIDRGRSSHRAGRSSANAADDSGHHRRGRGGVSQRGVAAGDGNAERRGPARRLDARDPASSKCCSRCGRSIPR